MKRLVVVVVSILFVLLLAACGSGDDSGTAGAEGAGESGGAAAESAEGPTANTESPDEGGSTGSPSGDGSNPSNEELPDFSSAEAIGMELLWRVVGDELEVRVSAPTTGWVAVGFDPSRMMKDANILIGYVEAGSAVVTDQFGITATGHRRDVELDGSDDVTVIGGTEAGGESELHFSIPLDSGDERDRTLVPGEEYRVILAYGEDGADDVESYHQNRGGVTITL